MAVVYQWETMIIMDVNCIPFSNYTEISILEVFGAFLVKRLLLHTPHALASSLRRGLHSGFTCYWTRHIWGIRGICPRWSVHFNDTSSQGAYALLTHLVFMTWKRLFVSLVYLIQFSSSLLIKRLKNTNIFLYIFLLKRIY